MKTAASVLVDTGLILGQLRDHQPTIHLLRELRRSDQLAISAVTRLEVRARMHEHERYYTQKLLSRFVTFAVDSRIADLAGDLTARSRSQSLLSLPDAMIAATALLEGLTLVTYNVAHFAPIRGLSLHVFPRNQ
jgi:predicted nucleic acid-binding protein